MEFSNNRAYRRARMKVEALKGFYHHLSVFIALNILIILFSAGVFSSEKVDLWHWTNYITAFFWGIGLVCHGLYVFFLLNSKNNFLKNWEDRKIQKFLDEDKF